MLDSILLEVLRCKLEAIAQDGANTIVRTAISPIVSDAADCSCAVFTADGELIVGGGAVGLHFHMGCNGIQAIKKLHGDNVVEGDLFLVNDPYNGGGAHAQDVFVHLPIFSEGVLCAWVGASAHMVDMGGMVPGSFSTRATEVYQEAFRLPPVRLFRAGVEQSDIWSLLRNNIRMAGVVEMDLRSLISGVNVVRGEIQKLLGTYGHGVFLDAVAGLIKLTEAEARRSIFEIEPGTYRAASWSEWTDEYYYIPCELTVENDHLIFDFSGSSPQTDHFINSKPYIVQSMLGIALSPYIGFGLPFNEGIFRTFEIRCDVGSILDAQVPAPIGGAHLDVGQTAAEVAIRALNLAIAASPRSKASRMMAGPSASSAMALHTLAGRGHEGEFTGWVMLDGALVGASAGHDRDATPLTYLAIGSGILEIMDIEVVESWYPIRFGRRALRVGTGGGGTYCAGRPASLAYTVAGTKKLSLTIMGNRERLPIAGVAGGLPGAPTGLELARAGSGSEPLPCHQEDIQLAEGDTVIVNNGNGGGWGDPLLRDPALVETDVALGNMSLEDARLVYGVILGDPAATANQRARIRGDRLAAAEPAPRPLEWTDELRIAADGVVAPLAPNVEQRGAIAVATNSGAPLAVSPDSWIDGCPRIHRFMPASEDIDIIAYLDPMSGDLLVVDVVSIDSQQPSFDIAPRRWTEATGSSATVVHKSVADISAG